MFILENLPWNCADNSCLKFARNTQNFLFVIPNIIDSQYDFPLTLAGMAFEESFDTNYFCHPSIKSILLVESCSKAKWLAVNTKPWLAD